MFCIREFDIDKLNSLTKYPSIPTYHTLDGKGKLTDEYDFMFADEPEVIVTEKIDGTNGRIVLLPDGQFLIGGRGELLWYSQDVLARPDQGIVACLGQQAKELAVDWANNTYEEVAVVYAEVYGAKVQDGKQYGVEPSWRVFDVWDQPFAPQSLLREVYDRPIEDVARWRDEQQQLWWAEDDLQFSQPTGDPLPITPRLATISGRDLPTGHQDCLDWMASLLPHTQAAIGDHPPGRAEGVVIRTPYRERIAKLRFDDYRRALR